MRRRILAASFVVAAVVLAACTDKTTPLAPIDAEQTRLTGSMSTVGCVDPTLLFETVNTDVTGLINTLFISANHRSSTLTMWDNLKKDKLESRPLQNHIDNLAKWTLEHLSASELQDPDGSSGILNATTGAVQLLDLVFRCAGEIPTQLPDPPAGFDAAFELVPATTENLQFNTSLGDAGTYVPGGSLENETMLVIVRQPPEVTVNTPFPTLSHTVDVALAGGKVATGKKLSVLFCPINELSSEVAARAVVAHQLTAVPPGSPVGQGVEYLAPPEGGQLLCPHDQASAWRMEKGFLKQRAMQVASLARKAWGFLGPKPLYAGHAAIGGTIGGFLSPLVVVDPYLETEVVNVTATQTATFGDAVNVTARLRIRDIPANPAVYRGQWVNPDAVTAAVNNVGISAQVDAGAPSATTIDATSNAAWSFACIGAGAHTATVNFPETPVPAYAPLYGASTANVAFSVSQRDLTVTANDKSRLYGDPNPTLDGSLVGVQTQCDAPSRFTTAYATAATLMSDVDDYPITADVTIDESGGAVRAADYNEIQVNGTLTINPAPLAITANNKTREYGLDNPTFDGNIVGIKNSDAISLTFATAATIMSEVGNYPIVPTAVGERLYNYVVNSTTNGALSITQAPLAFNIGDASRQYGDVNPAFTSELVGIRNSDAITANLTTTAGAATPVGTAVIDGTLSGARLGNYNVTKTTGTLTITQRPLSVTVIGTSVAYGESYSFGTSTNAVNGDAFSYTFNTSPSPAVNVGTYAVGATVGGAAAANYAPITVTPGVLDITPRALTGTIDNKTKVQGEANPALTGSVGNTVAGDGFVVTYATTATTSSPVGGYPITVDLTVAGGSNYSWLAANNGTLTITAPVGDIPNPVLVFSTMETSGGVDRYIMNVTNSASYPQSMFDPAPDLPPCGLNTNSSQSWVEIFNGATNAYIYGFCALAAPANLNGIWFGVPTGTQAPSVYIKITDRRSNTVYTSNTITFPAP
jgi:hypothetical protein